MKGAAIFFALLAAAWTAPLLADSTPSDSDKPLFQIFAAVTVPGDHPKATWDDRQPLLSVYSVRDLVLAKDNKGVLIGMNEQDTKTFSLLTHKYNDGLLILVAWDDSIEVLHITAPIEDGYIGFRHPQEDAIATYLRKRFKIGEFRETPKKP